MYLLTEWKGWTGNYLTWSHGELTERRDVLALWPRAKYFPVRPDLTHSINILINDHRSTQFWLVAPRAAARLLPTPLVGLMIREGLVWNLNVTDGFNLSIYICKKLVVLPNFVYLNWRSIFLWRREINRFILLSSSMLVETTYQNRRITRRSVNETSWLSTHDCSKFFRHRAQREI